MVVAAGFCPHPPLLVPALAGGAAAELDDLRAACDLAVRRLLAGGPRRIHVLGAGPRPALLPAGWQGTLGPYGVDVPVHLGTAAPGEPGQPGRVTGGAGMPGSPGGLTLPFALGGWLLGRAGHLPPVCGVQVGPGGELPPLRLDSDACLLVMGDASASRFANPSGTLDSRAVSFDDAVAQALGSGDPAALRELDPALGAAVLAAGMPAWLAAGTLLSGARYRAELLYAGAPYGVGYIVASWTILPTGGSAGAPPARHPRWDRSSGAGP